MYPNKRDRYKAWLVWAQLLLRDFPEAYLEQSCIKALAWQVKADAWVKDGGAFVPHLRTWLYGRRWEDEQGAPVKARTTGWAGVHDGEYPDGEQKI